MDIEEAVVLEDADDVGGQLNAVGGRPRAAGILELDGFYSSTFIWYDIVPSNRFDARRVWLFCRSMGMH